jgi:hypothetical protein
MPVVYRSAALIVDAAAQSRTVSENKKTYGQNGFCASRPAR